MEKAGCNVLPNALLMVGVVSTTPKMESASSADLKNKTIRVTWIGRDDKQVIERAREKLPREMTAEEKRRFYLAVD